MTEKIKVAELERLFEEIAKVAFAGPYSDMRRVNVVRFVEELVPAFPPLLRLARAAKAVEHDVNKPGTTFCGEADCEWCGFDRALSVFDFS